MPHAVSGEMVSFNPEPTATVMCTKCSVAVGSGLTLRIGNQLPINPSMPLLVRASWLISAFGVLCLATSALALNTSQGVTGSNHLRAQRYANGAGVEVGIIDTAFYGILPANHLDNRLIAQYDFQGRLPGDAPVPLANPMDDHETLAANIIAGSDAVYMGVAPAASIVLAAVDDVVFDSRRAASSWLHATRGTKLLNLSAGFGTNTNGTSTESLYWDWFMQRGDTLLVSAAGNIFPQLKYPADSYNGIAVGAMNDAGLTRWVYSAYQLNGGAAGTEVRGKPDILAPGVDMLDGQSFSLHPTSGTSFAAPHVVGAAALVTEFAAAHPATDVLDHRGIKALLLNSARKRHITTPEVFSSTSLDNTTADAAYDKDYVICATTCTIANAATAGLTQSWTPDGWSFDGTKFSVTKPLDDEQGVGFLDATRAIINTAGGNYGPGGVAGIGWDESTIAVGDSAAAHTYTLQQTLAGGSFLTATLVWDRVVNESDGNGIVELADTYAFGELANLDLRVVNASNQVIAESVSTTDNVEHLHFPLPGGGNVDDYKLQVIYNGGGVLATDYALAWWTDPTPLVPGDYNLDGVVNGLDYDVWRANVGRSLDTTPLIAADGDASGTVDAADYVVWRDHVGQMWSAGTSLAEGAAVPEPRCAWLVFTLASSLVFVTGRRVPLLACPAVCLLPTACTGLRQQTIHREPTPS